MKDIIILLLIIGLCWGGYKGMVLLSNYAQTGASQSNSVEEAPLADNSKKRLNKSAIEEIKKRTPPSEKKETPIIKKAENVTPAEEKTNGQKAMEAVRNNRLDIEGNPRSKEDFYKESDEEESRPYERKNTPAKKSATSNLSDVKDQKVALAAKGKALAGEFSTKGGSTKKSNTKTAFNIEKGENEPTPSVAPTARPKEYGQSSRNFVPSKYILVVGSYASSENAVKEVIRLQKAGYQNAGIVLSEKNLNLVSLGTFADKGTAKAKAAQIKKTGIDLYVKGIR